jgi:hypothetical protein
MEVEMSATHVMQALVRGAGDAMLCKLLYEVKVMRTNKTLPEEKQIALAVTSSYLSEECARRFGKDLVRKWAEAQLDAGKPIDPVEFFLPLKSNQAQCA